ncbi:hypothetical protein [Burkholderia sp. BCC0405]|uniref:hypothetical protein n=1 Tax=Burkholderia sp. BCC0405 TaxID=2676298 RepID=UPI0015887DA5|nr:hypothetical protein [Burkholderia sp. BCC0405]
MRSILTDKPAPDCRAIYITNRFNRFGETIIHGSFGGVIPASGFETDRNAFQRCRTDHLPPPSNADLPVSMTFINLQIIKYRRLPLFETIQAIT